jgi:amidohydrolase
MGTRGAAKLEWHEAGAAQLAAAIGERVSVFQIGRRQSCPARRYRTNGAACGMPPVERGIVTESKLRISIMNAPESLNPFQQHIDAFATQIEANVIAWRRDIHEHPELGNREVRTAGVVAAHLRSLGFEVKEKVAVTGVVGLLRGAKPGPVVALRADMDALPVSEEVDVPFASTVKTVWNGIESGVMHACGHDAHVAILMGVADVLSRLRNEIAGSVKFIFQPAEEMPPEGEEGGALLMIKEGVLENPRVDAIFGLHVISLIPSGMIGYRPGPLMASADDVKITVSGRQTHGAMPWLGVDPIVISAQIVLALQTIVSRQVDVTREPSVLTIGSIHGGIRNNIIPDVVKMHGTVRTFNEDMRADILTRVEDTCCSIAKAGRAHAQVDVRKGYSVTVNDTRLTEESIPTLERVAGRDKVFVVQKICGAEDFCFFQQKVPGFFFFLGCTAAGKDAGHAAPNHSPRFFVDEAGLKLGVRSLAALALDYLVRHRS